MSRGSKTKKTEWEDCCWRVSRAYGEFLKPKTIVLGGGDHPPASEGIAKTGVARLQGCGRRWCWMWHVSTLGIYFATFRNLGVDGGKYAGAIIR